MYSYLVFWILIPEIALITKVLFQHQQNYFKLFAVKQKTQELWPDTRHLLNFNVIFVLHFIFSRIFSGANMKKRLICVTGVYFIFSYSLLSVSHQPCKWCFPVVLKQKLKKLNFIYYLTIIHNIAAECNNYLNSS